MDTVREVKRKKIICFDFDGVIHSYINGWAGIDLATDLPVTGIKGTIDKLRVSGKYKIVIYSSRCSQEAGIQCIKEYCAEYNIYYDEVTNIKPPAFLTIDDRCISFNGVADDLFYKIENFIPWQKTLKKLVVNDEYDYKFLNLNFRRDLKDLINKYSLESDSNTPDYLIVQCLIDSLGVMNSVINCRDIMFGRKKVEE